MTKPTVVIEDLAQIPGADAFKDNFRKDVPQPLINAAIKHIFDHFGGAAKLLKSSKRVYIKPNGIDFKQFCYTSPAVLEAIIRYFFENGAADIFLIENSTQSNYTRLVYAVNGYKDICKQTGAKPVYLDEEKTRQFAFHGHKSVKDDPKGYDLTSFEMPETVVRELIESKNENLYINVPKLKTHSMAIVTLGIKNQWAFPRHVDRKFDHNYNLHSKFVDVLQYVQPDFTLIDGTVGTVYGHYPLVARQDQCCVPFRVLVGGSNVLAVDIVGARIFGLDPADVPHLRIAIERDFGEGVKNLQDINVVGNLNRFTTKYPTNILQEFPPDVNLVQGKTLACREGCVNNPLMTLQMLWLDFGGKGGFDLVFGKGFDQNIINTLKGPVLLAGHCAIEEVGQQLIHRLGRKNVYCSDGCNNLAATSTSLFRLMQVSPMKLVPLGVLQSLSALLKAKWHRSKAKAPPVLAKLFKYT